MIAFRSTALCFFALLILAAKAQPERFYLFKDGEAQAVILNQAELAGDIKLFNNEASKCAGSELPLQDSLAKDKNNILFNLIPATLENDDAFSMDFPEPTQLRINCTKRSARWALNHILREYFGLRWLFVDNKKIYEGEINEYPQARDISLPRESFEQPPYSFWLYRGVDWRARGWDYNWGAKIPFVGSHFIPVDVFPVWKYAPEQSWPEEIMPIINGKRYLPPKPKGPLPSNPYLASQGYNTGWNPCFSNPKTTEIAIENILEKLAAEPERVEIDMGVNDNGGMCECESCKKAQVNKKNSMGRDDWSELYWAWVNNVAKAVAPRHPNVRFVAFAYREVVDPPSFKLHPSIVVKTCFELVGMNDPAVHEKRDRLMQGWAGKATSIMQYDYSYGLGSFLLPRIYFASHSKFLKELYYKYNVRGMFAEASIATPFEGPKHYLMFELMRDIDADPEAIVMQWCVDTVGAQAAASLRRYYQFWEDYWASDAIKLTQWYRGSHANIYMQLGERSSHLFALRQGDMAALRSLMQEVVDLAASPSQKKRALALMQCFELSECAAKALLAEQFDPSGQLASATAAVELLSQLPEAFAAMQRLAANPFVGYLNGTEKALPGNLMSSLGAILPYLNEEAVQAELKSLSVNASLPNELQGQIKVWLGAKGRNLIKNGSFELSEPLPSGWARGRLYASRSSQYASEGAHAMGGRNPMLEYNLPVEHGKTYMVLFDAYANKASAEGRLRFMLSPSKDDTAYDHIRVPDAVLPGGKWQSQSMSVRISKEFMNNLRINIWGVNYESDEAIYIDNVRCYCLDELEL